MILYRKHHVLHIKYEIEAYVKLIVSPQHHSTYLHVAITVVCILW